MTRVVLWTLVGQAYTKVSDFEVRDFELGKVRIYGRGQWSRQKVTDFALIRKGPSHAPAPVLILDGAVPSGHAHRHAFFRHASHTQTSVKHAR